MTTVPRSALATPLWHHETRVKCLAAQFPPKRGSVDCIGLPLGRPDTREKKHSYRIPRRHRRRNFIKFQSMMTMIRSGVRRAKPVIIINIFPTTSLFSSVFISQCWLENVDSMPAPSTFLCLGQSRTREWIFTSDHACGESRSLFFFSRCFSVTSRPFSCVTCASDGVSMKLLSVITVYDFYFLLCMPFRYFQENQSTWRHWKQNFLMPLKALYNPQYNASAHTDTKHIFKTELISLHKHIG